MHRSGSSLAIFLMAAFLAGGLVGCGSPAITAAPTLPPAPPPSATPSPPPATLEPSWTPPPTFTPTVTATQPSPTPKPLFQGIVTYNRANQMVGGFDLSANPLPIKVKAAGAEWIGFNQGQWINNTFYYIRPSDKSVVQVSQNGTPQKLGFIQAKDDLSFTLSKDGKRIAWSFSSFASSFPASELWVGNLDGTGLKQVAKIDPANNSKYMVLHPLRWLSDGRLLYIEEPGGIGGYILFYGFAGLYLYDPANSKLTNLTPKTGAGNLCLSEVSPNLKTLASTCGGSQTGVLSYIDVDTNKVTSITRQADQNQAGSAVWSPSGAWMAYAYARANPNNEMGVVAVAANQTTTPKILASQNKSYFNVKGWVSETQFIVQRFDNDQPSVWLFSRDGTPPLKLGDGQFINLIPQ